MTPRAKSKNTHRHKIIHKFWEAIRIFLSTYKFLVPDRHFHSRQDRRCLIADPGLACETSSKSRESAFARIILPAPRGTEVLSYGTFLFCNKKYLKSFTLCHFSSSLIHLKDELFPSMALGPLSSWTPFCFLTLIRHTYFIEMNRYHHLPYGLALVSLAL